MTDLRKSLLNKNRKQCGFGRSTQDFTPLKASDYFEDELEVVTKSGTFHIYKKGNAGPMLCCLHGGGYSGLTWALFAVEICVNIQCQVVALDLRGHGNTTTADDSNLSLEVLAEDVADVLNKLCEDSNIPVVLIGHSMGGAIAVASVPLIKTIAGLCVIDVVEGTALESLSSMQNILRGRPSSFKSIEQAIQWCYKSGQTRNIEAARISMLGQIIKIPVCESLEATNHSFVIQEVEEEETPDADANFAKPPLPKTSKTTENDESPNQYVWRIDLKKTEPYWTGWFKGLSQKFLDLHIPKILLLANIHGLDTALTVGQMQGKFQFQVLTKSGHAIHEDQPHHVAEIISTFLVKHKLTMAKEGFEVNKSFI